VQLWSAGCEVVQLSRRELRVASSDFGIPNATMRPVSVFKRGSPTHVHIRTPVMIGVVGLLVILLSAVCYYRVSAVCP